MGEKLYKFLQINEEQAAAMIPALQVPWGIERQLHFLIIWRLSRATWRIA